MDFHQEGAIVATWIHTLSEELATEVLLLLTKAACFMVCGCTNHAKVEKSCMKG